VAKSDKQWLRRHVTDPYVRKANAQGYRSRAAFKLLEIDSREKLFRPGMMVVDLGAAPGSWSQVAAQAVKPGGRVIAVDILELVPISGVSIVRGDFRDDSVLAALGGARADVVVSDLSPNLSGIPNVDQARSAELVLGAVDFCRKALKADGAFLTKTFQGERFDEVMAELKQSFLKAKVLKPSASRGESSETYMVARGLRA
jgi:23S rRNA (uridine2552-2'-O)-methyltransferase